MTTLVEKARERFLGKEVRTKPPRPTDHPLWQATYESFPGPWRVDEVVGYRDDPDMPLCVIRPASDPADGTTQAYYFAEDLVMWNDT